MSDPGNDAVRADVWLWRARFFKTRSLAAKFVDEGRIRLTRGGAESRVDKPSRTLKPGDVVVFGLDCGERRGPATEARGLYEAVEG
jgi:ribosome-associated heat shock protein Hsp15